MFQGPQCCFFTNVLYHAMHVDLYGYEGVGGQRTLGIQKLDRPISLPQILAILNLLFGLLRDQGKVTMKKIFMENFQLETQMKTIARRDSTIQGMRCRRWTAESQRSEWWWE